MLPTEISSAIALSFDDVLLVPGHSRVLPTDVSLQTTIGPLTLNIPVISAAMDTVTEERVAIAMALIGGLGVLHKNCSVEEQVQMLKRVKKFQHGTIAHPITIRPEQSIADVLNVIAETGVTGFPVIDDGQKLLGMCTGRDLRYEKNLSRQVREVMSTPAKVLPEGASKEQAEEFFKKHKVEKLPLVDAKGCLKGLMTSRDLRQATDHPQAVRDASGSLLVAGSIGVGPTEIERAKQLVSAGADCLVVDSAHGHSDGVLNTIKQIAKLFPGLALVGGNVGTLEGAQALIDAGANIVKIGVGPGSICTTRIVSGAGVPQLTAVMEVADTLRKKNPKVGIISDGGIRFSGDITKALGAGAHSVMLGSLLAGTEESPGEVILYQGRSYKSYRGMGSLSAMKKGSKDRYGQASVKESSKLVPEGVEARVPYRGTLKQVVEQLTGGLRSGMGYVGAASISELFEKARFRQISPGALRESHVHDVQVTAESPNYHVGGNDK